MLTTSLLRDLYLIRYSEKCYKSQDSLKISRISNVLSDQSSFNTR